MCTNCIVAVQLAKLFDSGVTTESDVPGTFYVAIIIIIVALYPRVTQ